MFLNVDGNTQGNSFFVQEIRGFVMSGSGDDFKFSAHLNPPDALQTLFIIAHGAYAKGPEDKLCIAEPRDSLSNEA